MKFLRYSVIALFLCMVAFMAVGSPLAKVSPAAAMIAAGFTLWAGFALCTPNNAGLMCNLSTPSSLKLDRILSLILRQFKRRIIPITKFSTVFQFNPLGLDKTIRVPYVSLDQSDSQDWDANLGYGEGDFSVDQRTVNVDKRKFMALSFTSDQLRDLPIDMLAEGMLQKADKLAYDVMTDIFSVVTRANYGDPLIPAISAGSFDSDDVADINHQLSLLNWPGVGRSLILDDTYTTNLQKDKDLKNALNSGTTDTLREGTIGRVSSMDVMDGVPNLPDNGEKLVGVTGLKYGILIGAAPIEPSAEVRSQLTDYRVTTDPTTGLTLTYRAWGNADFDLAKRIVEFSYGYRTGDTAQLKRLEKP